MNQLNAKVERQELACTYVDDFLMVFGMLMIDVVQRYKLRTGTPMPPAPRRGRYVKKARKTKRPLATGPAYQLAVNAYTVSPAGRTSGTPPSRGCGPARRTGC
ncbi:hypothetical protein ACH4OW_34960 [Streptomyces sp. NPDC017056]|uniref:hypothetical protein n=1 Tax=Streptomyces sp. NPDC017056 TaxID=3364973 RepID=UPI00378C94D0